MLGLALAEGHPWREQAREAGVIAFDLPISALAQGARTAADALLLDAGPLTPEGLDAVRSYRIARPATRIVVSLPPEAQPGDPVPAGLVAMGVYDLCPGGTALADALARRGDYAAAVRWLHPGIDPQTGQTVRVEVRERVVERRVALSSRPVLVAVAGACPGAGATTVALAVARLLAGHGSVVLLEVGAPGIALAEAPAGVDVVARTGKPGAWDPPPDVASAVRSREHAWVVADLGAEPLPESLARDADLLLVALPAPVTRSWRWTSKAAVPLGAAAVHVVVPEVLGGEGRLACELWREVGGVADVAVLPPGDRAREEALARILAPLLPDGRPRRRLRIPGLPGRRAKAALRGAAPQAEAPAPGPDPPRPAVEPEILWEERPATAEHRLQAAPASRGPGSLAAALGTLGGVLRLAERLLGAAIELGLAGAAAWVALLVAQHFAPHGPWAGILQGYSRLLRDLARRL